MATITKTLTGTLTGGRQTTFSNGYWGDFWQVKSGSNPLKVGGDSSNKYATNIMFNATTLNQLRSRSISSIVLTLSVSAGKVHASGNTMYAIGYKYTSSSGAGVTTYSDHWARSNADSTAKATSVVAYLTTGTSSEYSGAKTYTLSLSGTVPKYGYTMGPGNSTTTQNITLSSASLAVTYTAYTYTVSYNKGAEGTGENTSDTKTEDTALALKGAIFTRAGYTQTGWSTSDGGAKVYNLGASYTANAAVTLYPYWTANTATIKFNVNEGTITTGTGTTRYRVSNSLVQVSSDSGSTWADLTDTISTGTEYVNLWNVGTYGAVNTGHHVDNETAYRVGSTSGRLVNQQTTSASDTNAATVANLTGSSTITSNTTVTLYVNWLPDTYTVSFDKGAYGDGTNTTDTKTYGVDLTLPGAIFTRTGYKQAGWTSVDGGSKEYDLNGSYTANAAITLYPFWEISSIIHTKYNGVMVDCPIYVKLNGEMRIAIVYVKQNGVMVQTG